MARARLMFVESVHPGAWAPGHRALAGFVAGCAAPFSPQELFEIFTKGGVVFFNYEVSKNVFSRQEGEPTKPEHVPAPSDGNFEGYSARVKKALNGARYCLRMTEPHVGSPEVFERLIRLVAPLEGILAEESRAVRTTVFVGDYEYTPFGVHVDPYPQIQCAISGERTALFWDDPYWAGKTSDDRLAPWKHLAAAHEVKMPAGDAVYWAPAYEHAFSSRGEHAIALTISFPEVPPPDSELEVVRRKSAHHFLNVPPARPPRSFSPDQLLCGNPLFPITLAADGKLVAAGRIFEIAGVPDLSEFVARVSRYAPFRHSEVDDALVDVFYTHYAIDAIDAV